MYLIIKRTPSYWIYANKHIVLLSPDLHIKNCQILEGSDKEKNTKQKKTSCVFNSVKRTKLQLYISQLKSKHLAFFK